MTAWALVGHDGQRGRAFALRGASLVNSATGPDAATALAALGPTPDRILRIGDGPPDAVPAPLLPDMPGPGLAGLTQQAPPDVIDGWVRLLLLGMTRDQPDWDGVACVLAGDIRHWVHLSAGEAVSCQSFLTPRLAMTLGATTPLDTDALADTLSRPERLATHLRSAEVTGNTAALSGHLIGAELAAARPYWLGQNVAVIAPEGAESGVADALERQGVPTQVHDPEGLLAPAFAALATWMG
ncbi:2-dehydro-3-deoxygalactonokinase [Roseovarius tibetensis]|uniref:2-dehydro-3-deoxygalactonokinase n=1 Tax=Roseovarius tibetensis TaxID=2685897 RepID=UPI003D7F1AA9